MKRLLILSLSLWGFNAMAAGYTASNGTTYPWCTENAIDPDNDGWGWENEASCKVAASTSAPQKSTTTERQMHTPPPSATEIVSSYGKGQRRIRVRGNGHSAVVRCYSPYTSDEKDGTEYWAYVKVRLGPVRHYYSNSLKFSTRHASRSCARNATVVKCSFTYDLNWCEKNVRSQRRY